MENRISKFSIQSLLNENRSMEFKQETDSIHDSTTNIHESDENFHLDSQRNEIMNMFLSSQFAIYQSYLNSFLAKTENNLMQLPLAVDNDLPIIFPKRIGHPYQNRNPPKRKKPRTSFNRAQIAELEKRFLKQKYLPSSERSNLARLLKITDGQVKTWFQNRRTKARRIISEQCQNNLRINPENRCQTVEQRETDRLTANRLLLSITKPSQANLNDVCLHEEYLNLKDLSESSSSDSFIQE